MTNSGRDLRYKNFSCSPRLKMFKVSAEDKNFGVVYLPPAQNFKQGDATDKVIYAIHLWRRVYV
ncbi:MAG: hypothetical protein IJK81_05515 [Selenomonadaceae bacterium]|nr:hypothetical protein [Selenomonadaceae bacterium]